MSLKRLSLSASVSLLLLAACEDSKPAAQGVPHDLDRLRQVLVTNADLAHALYSDAVDTAVELQAAITALLSEPTPERLVAARRAWLVAREPYGLSEVYRFRASPIDDTDDDPSNGEDGPEGDINAWPLGEALIDYVVEGGEFGADSLGVTDHATGVPDPIPGNNLVHATAIPLDAALLGRSSTADDERDVIVGYHAIEFLLWGQDLNHDGSPTEDRDRSDAVKVRQVLEAQGRLATHGGQRPASDFDVSAGCTSGPGNSMDAEICARRGSYLALITDKLIEDLSGVRDAWAPAGSYRQAFTAPADLAAAKGRLLQILTGMGTLSEGELAGERMQIALAANSQEDEHSCFSDNTHRDIWLNAEGVALAFTGRYPGFDRSLDGRPDATERAVQGYGVDAYLRDLGQGELASRVSAALEVTRGHTTAIDASARAGAPVDVLISDPMGEAARPMREAIRALNAQSGQIAQIAVALELGRPEDVVDPEASACDTTDPTTVCD